jgi:lipopolysaccharide export system permease protein
VSILTRYTVKEIVSHLIGVLAVVLGIFLIRRIGVILDDTAGTSVSTTVILHLLGLRTIMALPSLMPVVVYLSVLLGLSRLYRDQEITALVSCGVAPRTLRKSVLGFGAVAAIVIAVVSFSARPWAATRFESVKHRAEASVEMGSMSPGRFYEINGDQEQVMFAEGRTDVRAEMRGLFVQQREDDQISIFLSERAIEHRDDEQRFRILQLLDGRRYDLDMDGGDHAITSYHEFMVRTPLDVVPEEAGDEEALSTMALFASAVPADRAELQWRLAMPISALLLVGVAVPLSRVEPRQGKYAKVLVAMAIYMTYRHLLGMAKNWVAAGAMEAVPGFLAIHALCLVTALVLLARDAGWGRMPRRRGRLRSASV